MLENYTLVKYKVHNLQEGNRPAPTGYRSWIDYWEKATGQKALLCREIGCLKQATDGAHVQLDDSYDNRWYIVPMCHPHNCQFGAHFTVDGPLVSATNPSVILK